MLRQLSLMINMQKSLSVTKEDELHNARCYKDPYYDSWQGQNNYLDHMGALVAKCRNIFSVSLFTVKSDTVKGRKVDSCNAWVD